LKPVVLQNQKARLAILVEAGARVVEYRLIDGNNVILADPASWADRDKIPKPSPHAGWYPLNGHIYWLGPQDEWWKHQKVNPKRSGKWPPDPYLIYGQYEILGQSPDFLRVRSPESPVSGIQMTKEFRLYPDGRVTIEVRAKNIRQEEVAWDIWSNTRVTPDGWAYVPIRTRRKGYVWIDDWRTDDPYSVMFPRYTFAGGFFSFISHSLVKGYKRQYGKIYFGEPRLGYIAAVIGKTMFIKRADPVPRSQQAPRQCFIEIYTQRRADGKDGLLELEMHSAYHKLKPGEEMKFREEWFLFPYTGENSRQAHISEILKVERKLYPDVPPPLPPLNELPPAKTP
ncbi:MAG: DUF4380 domain-containing protein, partial [Lentisphaerae bacterium]